MDYIEKLEWPSDVVKTINTDAARWFEKNKIQPTSVSVESEEDGIFTAKASGLSEDGTRHQVFISVRGRAPSCP